MLERNHAGRFRLQRIVERNARRRQFRQLEWEYRRHPVQRQLWEFQRLRQFERGGLRRSFERRELGYFQWRRLRKLKRQR
jgi:hypothetical protein